MTIRKQFLDNLSLYNLEVLKLQGVDIDKTIVKVTNEEIDLITVEEENNAGIDLKSAIEIFYNHYKDNNNIPYPGNYIKIVKNEYKNEIDKIKENIIKYKININEYIDTKIKPVKKNDNEEFKSTAVLKFTNVDENEDIELDKDLYFVFQNILKQESETKKIGINAKNWGYFGIVTNGLSAFFQMYTLYKTKSAKSFSMPFIWIMTILNAIYCLVGILENNIGLAVATFFFVIYNFTVIYVYYRYN
tara:strand:+ start:52 stop:789 length:738 start_codon:yes stop_codon:yes gene_type:complete